MESRVYSIGEKKMQFNKNAFTIHLESYGKAYKLKLREVEEKIAEKLNISADAVHKWHYGGSSPTDIDLVKAVADVMDLSDYTTLLKDADGGNKMNKLGDRQIDAVKKIYDVCIWFLSEFNYTDGFNDYWDKFAGDGHKDPECAIMEIADEMHRKIELVLDQEYFDLRDTEIYNELCEFVSEDLVDIYEGKVSYAYRFEAVPSGNPTTREDYDNAMIKLNGIIERYV